MPLTDIQCRNALVGDRPRKFADEKGLYLLVTKSGKYWRMDYRFAGKRKTIALGVYPEVPLGRNDEADGPEDHPTGARGRRNQARKLLAKGIDPMQSRRQGKLARRAQDDNRFDAVALEWHGKFFKAKAPATARKVIDQLSGNVFPWLGKRPVGEITAPELLTVLRRIEDRGALETAHRVKANCGRVFRYAIATGRAERDPSRDLNGALPAVKVTHHAAVTTPAGIADLLKAIDGFTGTYVVKCALRLSPLLFVRPGELRQAQWSEIDLDAARWTIPAERMKMRVEHIVPLCSQAVAILRDLQPLTGHYRLVFPGVRDRERPMSENTINQALRRLGYRPDEMTAHGFRTVASTLLNEQGWSSDAIERQLAHAERNQIRRAYNRAEHLPERVRMMQAWADYLGALRSGAEIVPIGRKATA